MDIGCSQYGLKYFGVGRSVYNTRCLVGLPPEYQSLGHWYDDLERDPLQKCESNTGPQLQRSMHELLGQQGSDEDGIVGVAHGCGNAQTVLERFDIYVWHIARAVSVWKPQLASDKDLTFMSGT